MISVLIGYAWMPAEVVQENVKTLWVELLERRGEVMAETNCKVMDAEFWKNLKEGDKLQLPITGYTATKKGDILVWDNDGLPVSAYQLLMYKWELLKEEEKGVETEKWERILNSWTADGRVNDDLRYDSPSGRRTPSEIMDNKNFLRFVGKMPDGCNWPGDQWSVWFSKEKNSTIRMYSPDYGYTKQVFAEYAEMRVEK